MRDGVYTPAQAKHGEALYKQECAPCYGDALEGNNQTERAQRLERAPLSGVFLGNWNGCPLSDLVDKVKADDAPGRAGTITLKQNADILAYMLKFNEFPAGEAVLPADPGLLTDTCLEAGSS